MSKVADRNQVNNVILYPSRELELIILPQQRQLLELLKLPGNDVCADCRSRNVSPVELVKAAKLIPLLLLQPRWASWDHGQFRTRGEGSPGADFSLQAFSSACSAQEFTARWAPTFPRSRA